MTNQTTRVLELLKRFNDGKMVKISELKNDTLGDGKSEKTILRDNKKGKLSNKLILFGMVKAKRPFAVTLM